MALVGLPLHEENPGRRGATGVPGPPGPSFSELHFGESAALVGPLPPVALKGDPGPLSSSLAPRAATSVVIAARHVAGAAGSVTYRVTVDGVPTAALVVIASDVDAYFEATIALVVPLGARVGVTAEVTAGGISDPQAMVRLIP